jgi:hypothetical protein
MLNLWLKALLRLFYPNDVNSTGRRKRPIEESTTPAWYVARASRAAEGGLASACEG